MIKRKQVISNSILSFCLEELLDYTERNGSFNSRDVIIPRGHYFEKLDHVNDCGQLIKKGWFEHWNDSHWKYIEAVRTLDALDTSLILDT